MVYSRRWAVSKEFWWWCITLGITDFWTLSIVRYPKHIIQHKVSEIVSVSVLGWGGTSPVTDVSSLKRTQQGVFPPHLRTETDPASETLCPLVFLEYWMMDEVRTPSNSERVTSIAATSRESLTGDSTILDRVRNSVRRRAAHKLTGTFFSTIPL
jgi:hypothetical protein